MALYYTCLYHIYTELCIYATLIVCYTILCASYCYTSMLSIDLPYCIDGVCLQACSNLKHVDHHGSGAGGARVVIMVVGVVPRYHRIHNR